MRRPQAERLEQEVAMVRHEGRLQVEEVRALYDRLMALGRRSEVRRVVVDFAAVSAFDSPSAAALHDAGDRLHRAGKQFEIIGLSGRQKRTFELISGPRASEAARARSRREPARGARVSRALLELAEFVVDTLLALGRAVAGRGRARIGDVARHAVQLGVDAVFIVALLTFLTGVILGFQAAYQLQRFGAELFMAEIVSLGMVREFAALMTAIILAGRSGSAMTAELGAMSVRSEIDALRTFGIDPIAFLAYPRVAALLLVQPALSMLAMVIGIGGGLLVASVLGLPVPVIYSRMQEALTVGDVMLGLCKSVLFATIIGLVGCYRGFQTRGGPGAVGHSTTRSVVTAIVLIVLTDSVVTTLWTAAGYGEP